MNLEITPLKNEALGALVHGWEPDSPLAEEDREIVLDALPKFVVLV